jgi:hypothetical protein
MLLVDIPALLYSARSRPDFDYGTLWYPEVPVPTLIVSEMVNFTGIYPNI